ncbi:coiled-coil domain-containing domain-containing protein [Trichoderma ceciliae]
MPSASWSSWSSRSSSPTSLMAITPDDRDHDFGLDKPVPRRPRTSAKLARLGVRNRRHEYLQRNPSYFDNLDHELADPVLYERLIKRFQTPAEREAEGKAKGYGRTLEADLVRGETKLSNFSQTSENIDLLQDYVKAPGDGGAGTNAWDAEAENKEHGVQLWRTYLEARFVEGLDEDFEYEIVDNNDVYDTMARRDAEEAWFDEEEPSWADGDSQFPVKLGETGVQDF